MANVLNMATVADIVTLIQAGSSDRRISALLSLVGDRNCHHQTCLQFASRGVAQTEVVG